MKTFTFIEKNGSAVLTFSAGGTFDATLYLANIIKDTDAWRFEEEEMEDSFEELTEEQKELYWAAEIKSQQEQMAQADRK